MREWRPAEGCTFNNLPAEDPARNKAIQNFEVDKSAEDHADDQSAEDFEQRKTLPEFSERENTLAMKQPTPSAMSWIAWMDNELAEDQRRR